MRAIALDLTRDLLPGRNVRVAPGAVEAIDSVRRALRVRLARDTIRRSRRRG